MTALRRTFAVTIPILLFALVGATPMVSAQDDDPAAAIQQALAQYGAATKSTVDQDKLKEVIRAKKTLLNKGRSKFSATSTMGSMMTIDATYEDEEGSTGTCPQFLRLRVTDLGSMQALAQFAGAFAVEVDEESRTGFRRTIKLEGNEQMKGLESWDSQSGRSELEMFVAGFSVNIDATCFGVGAAVKAAKELNKEFDQLAALRGAQPSE